MNVETQKMVEQFLKLPEKAQVLWFKWLKCFPNDATKFATMNGFDVSECNSPIESIFFIALKIWTYMYVSDKDVGFRIRRQKRIDISDKKYYVADFVLEHENKPTKKLIIECDGHEFHEKTKAQVAHDNERDLALKKLGYDILHFSGSQIYNESLKCAKEAYEYYYQIWENENGKSRMDSSA